MFRVSSSVDIDHRSLFETRHLQTLQTTRELAELMDQFKTLNAQEPVCQEQVDAIRQKISSESLKYSQGELSNDEKMKLEELQREMLAAAAKARLWRCQLAGTLPHKDLAIELADETFKPVGIDCCGIGDRPSHAGHGGTQATSCTPEACQE